MREFSNVLGGNVQHLIIGGAASGASLKQFLSECFRCPVYDGYGATECGSIASNQVWLLNHSLKYQYIFPDVKIKIVSVPEMGYSEFDVPYPRGEVYVKGPQLIDGYYKDQITTSLNFEDGWFKTGYRNLKTG